MSIIGWILFLVVAAFCGWIGDYLVGGTIPGGFVTAVLVGIMGAWIGGKLLGHFGPSLEGLSLIPTILGSAILVFFLAVVSRTFRNQRSA